MKRIITFSILAMFCLPAISQSVDIESIRVNKVIPYKIDLDELINSNLTVDSIVKTPDIMDALDADSLVYIGESYFEYYKANGKCILSSIVFDKKIRSIRLNGNIFNAKTTFQELKKIFPEDCKETRPISIYRKDKQYQTCSVGVTNKQGELWDMRILFFFSNNKLVIIDFWEPT